MQSETPFRVRLVVGDWSTDGHSMTKDIWVLSNRRVSDMELAYQKGSRIVGVDLTRDVCVEYEDSVLPAEVLVKLINAGFKGLEDFELKGGMIYDDTEYLAPEEFAKLWLFIASKGDPEMKTEVLEDELPINIGGYGLFSP